MIDNEPSSRHAIPQPRCRRVAILFASAMLVARAVLSATVGMNFLQGSSKNDQKNRISMNVGEKMKWIVIGVLCFLSVGSGRADTMKSSFTGDIGYASEEGTTTAATASNVATLGFENFAKTMESEPVDRRVPKLVTDRFLGNMGLFAGFLLVAAFLMGRAEADRNSGFN